MMDNTRNSLKRVNRFASREYKEKHPKSVRVLRLKSKNVLTRGVLPNYQVQQQGPVIYLVVSDQGDNFMLYFFNKMGENIGGQHYDLTSKFLKDLEKSTVLKTQFPKKIPKKIEDFTLMFQKEFLKLFYHINSILGINHKYPYTILVKKDLPVKHTKTLGAKRVNKRITIPSGLKNEGLLEFFVSLEWFYTYISSIIEINHRDNDKLLLYDLAILLCGVYEYKNLEKLSSLKENFKLISISDDFSRESIMVSALKNQFNLALKL
ncbi:hypothetical protein LCGC14_2110040 [marine sediment metagenome]|uniref:Uncharacterized protein n=1 Tax=marine sediment metagenome TaxID=412755 RepID=A0A0F9H3R7_9ZZZZ